MKKKEVYFILSLVGIIALPKLFSASPQATLLIMGILFPIVYLLFYARDIAVFYYKIRAEKALKNSDQALVLEFYRKIAGISPQSLSGKTALAIVHTLEGNWSAAEKLYREVLRERPGDTRIQYNLAVTLVKKGEYEEALRSLLLAIRVYPGWAVAYSAVAEVYLALENYELAYKYFKVALLLDGSDQSALRHLPLVKKKIRPAS